MKDDNYTINLTIFKAYLLDSILKRLDDNESNDEDVLYAVQASANTLCDLEMFMKNADNLTI